MPSSLLNVFELPGQFVHFGHGHRQFFFFFVEQRPDRFQVRSYNTNNGRQIVRINRLLFDHSRSPYPDRRETRSKNLGPRRKKKKEMGRGNKFIVEGCIYFGTGISGNWTVRESTFGANPGVLSQFRQIIIRPKTKIKLFRETPRVYLDVKFRWKTFADPSTAASHCDLSKHVHKLYARDKA